MVTVVALGGTCLHIQVLVAARRPIQYQAAPQNLAQSYTYLSETFYKAACNHARQCHNDGRLPKTAQSHPGAGKSPRTHVNVCRDRGEAFSVQ